MYSLFDNTKYMHCQDLSWDHSVNLCKLVRVIAIAWIECDHFCTYICIEISAAIFSIKGHMLLNTSHVEIFLILCIQFVLCIDYPFMK